jgi:transposase, IS30 family
MKLEGQETVSHETIYKLIYSNYLGMGIYQKKLRQGRLRRRKRGSKKSLRGRIPGRVGIEERPEIANQKTEIGHWESDTVIGGNHYGQWERIYSA